MTARLFSTFTAPYLQVFSQRLQAMQADLQYPRLTAAVSRERHATETFCSCVRSENRRLGQALTHLPQARHLFLSTRGKPSFPMLIALKGQTVTHVPSPIQPEGHFLGPPRRAAAARQSFKPE
jgi:hypothetical protein